MAEPNTPAAIEFLQRYRQGGPWTLVAIPTDKKNPRGITTTAPDELERFLHQHNGTNNIYFHVNPLMHPRDRKANKENIKAMDWLHVDIDPADPPENADMDAFYNSERERILASLTDKLPKGLPAPTIILFSGGGYQAFWKLRQPLPIEGKQENWEEAELYNLRLEQVFMGSTQCFNCDRIMRLPGTVNVPDAKKAKKGRKPTLAVLMQFKPKHVYDIDKFTKGSFTQTTTSNSSGQKVQHDWSADVKIDGNVERILDSDELNEWNVPDRLKVIMGQGHHPDMPKSGDNSRSAWLFDFIVNMKRCDVPDEVIYAIITDKEWAIAESVVELGSGAHKYAVRQIGRAKEYAEDPKLAEMNARHAVIGSIGGKCRVIEEEEDEILKRSHLSISTFEDIGQRYSNQMIKVGEDAKGNPIMKPLGKWWLNHPQRRQFDYLRFSPMRETPGCYNLWRGFSYEPVPGDCEIFLDHCKNNVCGGDEAAFDYLMRWMARAVQHPGSPGEVAVVLRGNKGSGKGTVAKVFGSLFGRHYLQIANAQHLVGNFNAHLRDVIVLFADEAFFAGDKRQESVLKALITEPSIPIERKGVDVENVPNYIHLIMAANDPHVVRASGDERRYFVLNVLDTHKQDTEYFGTMLDQLENGGYEALLYHLQSIDLSEFNVRDVPQTDALQEQKLLSMGVEEEWMYRKLSEARLLPHHEHWQTAIACETLAQDFTRYADTWKISRRGNATALGRFIKGVFPHCERKQLSMEVEQLGPDGRYSSVRRRAPTYLLGDLGQCRKAWEAKFGKTEWDIDLNEQSEMDTVVGMGDDVPF